jgi:hypothetical protein
VNLFASKQGAAASSVSGFALVQSTVAALLTRSVLGVLHFGSVCGIGQSNGLWVFLVHHGLGHGLRGCQGSSAQSDLHHENATVSLFHKISNEVAKIFFRTNSNFKNALMLKSRLGILSDLVKELSQTGNAL